MTVYKMIGYLLVIISAMIYASASIVVKFTYESGLAPIPVLILQNILSMFIIWTYLIVTKRKILVSRKLVIPAIAQGTVGGFLTSIFFFSALDMLGASLATLLLFTYPAIVAVYNAVFNRIRLTNVQKSAIVLAWLGIMLSVDIFSSEVGNLAWNMILIGLAAAVTNSFLTLNGEKLLLEVDALIVTTWSITFSTFMLLAVYQPWWMFDVKLSFKQIMLILLGTLSTLSPIAIYLAGLKRVGSNSASIISTIEIPITLVLAYLLLGEIMNLTQLLGGVLVIMSVFILYSSQDNDDVREGK